MSSEEISPEQGDNTNPATEETRKIYLEHLKQVNSIFYDQIRQADQKAAYIFTFMLAFLITSTEGRDVFKLDRYQAGEPVVIILSAIFAAGVVVTLVAAILVVLPRHVKRSTSLYWGGWPDHKASFLAAREKADPTYLFEQYLTNVDNLSGISRSKYRYVALSFRGLLLVVLAYFILLMWQAGTGA